jgi:hypothetical protein
MEGNRCFGRLKARELTAEELTIVGGGDPMPDVYHSRYCARSVSGGGMDEEPCHVGCTYTI